MGDVYPEDFGVFSKEETEMIKRLKRKKARLHSKKGMSLVEILVAVTIIVIVFGGTIGAMANGYSKWEERARDSNR